MTDTDGREPAGAPGRSVSGYYAVTALSTLASSYYFNYLFFLFKDRHGFGDRQNLWVAALHGFIYIFAAWQCGKFAERRGYHASLAVGLTGLTVCLVVGAFVSTAAGQLVVLATYTTVLLFIWPALEALVTLNQPPARIPHLIGLYNCTWSGVAAVAYFTGGGLYERYGAAAVFWLPAGIFAAQLALVAWLARAARLAPLSIVPPSGAGPASLARPGGVSPGTFLRLAWVANPLSYVAIYTLLAVMPGVAGRLGLSPTEAGWFCSIWFFARLAAFALLWQWPGWHYRFRWLGGAYAVLGIAFVSILLAGSLAMLMAAQAAFGLAAGLIYFSSLFYALDTSEAKAEHGGLHEAAIGLGICAGPAIGALSLQVFPDVPFAAAIAVTTLLLAGGIALVTTWVRARRTRPAA